MDYSQSQKLKGMLVDIHLYNALARRAAYPIYLRYTINRFELWMLSSLHGYLSHRGMTIVSKIEFFKFLSGNWRERRKQEGYFHGLLKKGLIGQYEYVRVVGSQSIGFSDHGVRVMRDYLSSVEEFMIKYRNKQQIEIAAAAPNEKYKQTA